MNERLGRIFLGLAMIALVAAIWTPVPAAQRQVVVLEGFTQWNCPPCASWNPQERALLNAMTRDTVISIKWHGWWPGANNDAFHLWNVAENTSRINLYGVTGVPTTKVDGATASQSQSTVRNAIRNRYNNIDSPCTIDNLVAVTTGPTSVYVAGTINAEEDLTGKRLFVVLITDEVTYQSPPGSNGETIFDDIFRDVYPNANSGEVIVASPGNPYEFTCNLNKAAAWDPEDLTVIAFVQTMATKEIHQTAWSEVSQDYAMDTGTDDPGQALTPPDGGEVVYTVTVNNIGNLDDIYTVDLLGDFPAGWSHTVEANGIPSDPTSIQLPVNTLQSADVIVRVNPNGVGGTAAFEVQVTSSNLPALIATEEFRLMSGLDILIVDDDDNNAFETWYEAALEPLEVNYAIGRWELALDELDPANLGAIDLVVWFTGNTFQDGTTLTALDQLTLADYLDGGGRLLLSGQGIGFDIRTDTFISSHLHAVYERNYPQGQNVNGFAGDPISDGLTFALTGGTGAGNQTRQSALTPFDQYATSIFSYTDSEWEGGLRIETEIYRAIYLGFGFEGIDDEADRNLLMQRSIEWLSGTSGIGDEEVSVPAEFSLGQNYPNPFNPETVIPYSLPVRADVTLKVFDVLGRQAIELFSGAQDAGNHTLTWNAASQSSGIYFYTLEAVSGENTFRSTRKLVLMK